MTVDRRDSTSEPASVWLLKDGEPLPIDGSARLLRTGRMAQSLADSGHDVTWWTSRFDHARKRRRSTPEQQVVELSPRYRLCLLDGPAYHRNLSLARLRNYRVLAAEFDAAAPRMRPPDVIVSSYPSPELCAAAQRFALPRRIPTVLDVRDAWPDNIAEFFPRLLRPALFPGLSYYRRKLRGLIRHATAVVSVNRVLLDWMVQYAPDARAKGQTIYIGGIRSEVPRSVNVPAQFSSSRPLRLIFLSSGGVLDRGPRRRPPGSAGRAACPVHHQRSRWHHFGVEKARRRPSERRCHRLARPQCRRGIPRRRAYRRHLAQRWTDALLSWKQVF